MYNLLWTVPGRRSQWSARYSDLSAPFTTAAATGTAFAAELRLALGLQRAVLYRCPSVTCLTSTCWDLDGWDTGWRRNFLTQPARYLITLAIVSNTNNIRYRCLSVLLRTVSPTDLLTLVSRFWCKLSFTVLSRLLYLCWRVLVFH